MSTFTFDPTKNEAEQYIAAIETVINFYENKISQGNDVDLDMGRYTRCALGKFARANDELIETYGHMTKKAFHEMFGFHCGLSSDLVGVLCREETIAKYWAALPFSTLHGHKMKSSEWIIRAKQSQEELKKFI